MNLLFRLACGSGRAAMTRQALVAGGIALGSALLLLAAGIASLGQEAIGSSGSVTLDCVGDECTTVTVPGSAGEITFAYLAQPGLRRGVVIGFVLCLIPLLVFVGTASRVAARQRDERFAALRLAGASARQVRGLALIDALLGGVVGVVLGTVGYLVVRQLVIARSDGQPAAIARETTPSVLLGAGVLALLLLALAATAVLTLRRLEVGPLAVRRGARTAKARSWPLFLLAPAVVFPLVVQEDALGSQAFPWLVATLALVMIGVAASGRWWSVRLGGLVASRTHRPAVLLAGRRLQDDPAAQARAMSAVLLVVFVVSIGLWPLAESLDMSASASDEEFRRQGFALAGLGALVSLVVASAGLLLTTAEGALERRRTHAGLHASGVPLSTLRRSLLVQVALPLLPASAVAACSSLALGAAAYSEVTSTARVLALAATLPFIAVGAALLMTTLTFPLMRGIVDVEQLRTP